MGKPRALTQKSPPTDYQLAKEIFGRWMELPAKERGPYIESLDEAHRHVIPIVIEMLQGHELADAQDFLNSTPMGNRNLASFSGLDDLPDLNPGSLIDDFEIRTLLGSGAFGRVYLARQLTLDRLVALKACGLVGSEARVLAKLEHPAVVQVFAEATLVERRLKLICMQFVDGTDLAKLLKLLSHFSREARQRLNGADILTLIEESIKGREGVWNPALALARDRFSALSFQEVVAFIGRQVAEALAFAHSREVLHLDVKPGNILISRFGHVYLSDFNVSRDAVMEQSGLSNERGGTPEYMAPEHMRAFESGSLADIDRRADLFSLGAVLYELLEGHRFDPDKTDDEHLSSKELPRDFEAPVLPLIMKCLTKEREKRVPNAETLVMHFDSFSTFKKIQSKLPALGVIMRFTLRLPAVALLVIPSLPQMLGTLTTTAYSLLRPGHLLPVEKRYILFEQARSYTTISYPLGYFLGFLVFWPVVKAVNRRKGIFDFATFNSEELRDLRKRALRLPIWRAAVNLSMWFPALPIFVLSSHRLVGYWDPRGYGHFVMSMIFALVISIVYSALFNMYASLRMFYPRLLASEPKLRQTILNETKILDPLMRWCPLLALIVPSMAALLFLGVGPGELSESRFRYFQTLLGAMIIFGGFGFAWTIHMVQRLRRVLEALRGNL